MIDEVSFVGNQKSESLLFLLPVLLLLCLLLAFPVLILQPFLLHFKPLTCPYNWRDFFSNIFLIEEVTSIFVFLFLLVILLFKCVFATKETSSQALSDWRSYTSSDVRSPVSSCTYTFFASFSLLVLLFFFLFNYLNMVLKKLS